MGVGVGVGVDDFLLFPPPPSLAAPLIEGVGEGVGEEEEEEEEAASSPGGDDDDDDDDIPSEMCSARAHSCVFPLTLNPAFSAR